MSDSSGPAQASEIVIGIFHPYREKMASMPDGNDGKYNVKILKDRIRCVQILKGRYGQSDICKCVNFIGEVGWFRELPNADDIMDYEPYINPLDEKPEPKKQESEVICDFSF